MTRPLIYAGLACLLAVAGCSRTPAQPDIVTAEAVLIRGEIETAADGRCFATAEGPTETVIVDELVEVIPESRAPDGTVTAPAVFRSVTRPETLRTGDGQRFETLCPPVYTADFVRTLQRALKVRRAYDGPISGSLDAATNAAIARFQAPLGIDSPLMDIRTARMLGLVALSDAQLSGNG